MFFACTAFGTSRTIVWLQAQRDRALDRQRFIHHYFLSCVKFFLCICISLCSIFYSRASNTVSPRRAELEATEFRMGRLRHERVRIPRHPNLLRSAMQV